MINPFSLVILALVLAVATLSPAQLRFAVDNPTSSITVFLNLGIVLAMIGLYLHFRKSSRIKNDESFQLVGSKGGKSERSRIKAKKNKDV